MAPTPIPHFRDRIEARAHHKTDTWADGPSWPITGKLGSRAVWDGNSVLVLGVHENVMLRFEGGVWSIEEREIPGGFVLCGVAESVYLG